MPRQKQNQQFESPSIDDILAGRVENEPFFDIDDLPVDAPAIARPFVPTPLKQVISGEANLDSHRDVGAAADEAPTGFDPAPENVPLPHRAPRTPRRLPTMEEIYDSLRDNPFAAFNFILSQEQIELEEKQKRRQREGLPPSPELQWQIDKRKRHIREGRSPSEFKDPEAELRNSLMGKPDELRDFDLRKALRELDKEMEERRERGLPMLDWQVRERSSLARRLGLTVPQDSNSNVRPASGTVKNVIPIPAIEPGYARRRGGFDTFTFGKDDELAATIATPFFVAARYVTGADQGKSLSERFADTFNQQLTRQRLLKEEARRQRPLDFGLGSAALEIAALPRTLLGLATKSAVDAGERFIPERSEHVPAHEIGNVRTRVINTRAKPGGEFDRELKTLRRNLTRDDGSPQTSKLIIGIILRDIEDRRQLPFTDPNALSPVTYRKLLPFLTELKKQAQ